MNTSEVEPMTQQQIENNQFARVNNKSAEIIIVKRNELNIVLQDAGYVSNTLHNIENLDDLSWQEMTELCRTSYRVVKLLSALIQEKEVEVR